MAAAAQAAVLAAVGGFVLVAGAHPMASIIVIRRFTGSRTVSENAGTRATTPVAVSFFLLAPLLVENVRRMLERQQMAASALGVAATAASVVVVPALGIATSQLGARLACASPRVTACRTPCARPRAPSWSAWH